MSKDVIDGRVLDADGDGVFGVTVHAIDSDHQFDDDIGHTRTLEDGSFRIRYDRATLYRDEPHEGEPEIYVRVLDREGNELYRDESVRRPPATDIEIRLEEGSLDRHKSHRIRLGVPDIAPVPEHWTDVIDSAINQVMAPRGTERHQLLMATALCPGPRFIGGPDIGEVARGAVGGDPGPIQEFRRRIEAEAEDRNVDPDDEFFSTEWRERVGKQMAERAAAFSVLADRDESITPGPISADRSLSRFADDRQRQASGQSDMTLEARSLTIPDPDALSAGAKEELGAVEADLRRKPAAIDPELGRTLLGGAIRAADDPETRRRYVATVFKTLRSLSQLRDTYVVSRDVLTGDAEPSALRRQLAIGAAECGPDDGPERPDIGGDDTPWEFPPIDPEDDIPGVKDIDDIIEDLIENHWWAHCQTLPDVILAEGDPYTITSISEAACPGETITINGKNFGSDDGKVVFNTTSGNEVRVDPESWSDSTISVTVPSDAAAGEIELDIVRGTSEFCNRIVVERAPPSSSSITEWSGGKPAVSLYSPAFGTDSCVEPGETIDISWSYRPETLSGVSLTVEDVGSQTLSDATGTWVVTVPSTISEPTDLTVRAEGSNDCGTTTDEETLTVDVEPTLTIDEMEISQGIQTFTVGPGGPDNDLDTIESKDTIVRVYVSVDRKGFNDDEVSDVTGSLRIGGRNLQPINGDGPTTAAPADPSITAVESPQRTETDHSLNFRVPAGLAQGQQTLTAYVQSPEICGDRATATHTENWSWSSGAALPVRYVRVEHNRSGTSQTQPSRAEAMFTLRRAFDLLPSPPMDLGPAPDDEMSSSQNLSSDDGVSGLLDELESFRPGVIATEWARTREGPFDPNLDTLQELLSHHYVALTEPFVRGIANNPGKHVVSCIYRNSDGNGIDGTSRRVKTAHELGHNLGFDHVNRGCGSSPDCNGSCYNHPNGGLLTDLAFDPHWNTVLRDDPDSTGQEADFMTYGCTRWTSADSWGRLQSNI